MEDHVLNEYQLYFTLPFGSKRAFVSIIIPCRAGGSSLEIVPINIIDNCDEYQTKLPGPTEDILQWTNELKNFFINLDHDVQQLVYLAHHFDDFENLEMSCDASRIECVSMEKYEGPFMIRLGTYQFEILTKVRLDIIRSFIYFQEYPVDHPEHEIRKKTIRTMVENITGGPFWPY